MTSISGKLYVVATPIGNLSDISIRALETLAKVDLIAAEDTRHTKILLKHHHIENRLLALHDHNESQQINLLVDLMNSGKQIALVSDAGTPLISDPGYQLVRELKNRAIQVIPIPGPSALIAALSVSGIPTDRFVFEGFIPSKSQARLNFFTSLENEQRTIVFYESTHRILKSISEMSQVWGLERKVCIARELTKKFESVITGSLAELLETLKQNPNETKGEFVVIVEGNHKAESVDVVEADRIVDILMKELSITQATSMVSEITGIRKKLLYKRALERKD